ncbi:MAG: hypothetical protein AB1779_03300 [Candidatus Thermoplasmatota archaeon]
MKKQKISIVLLLLFGFALFSMEKCAGELETLALEKILTGHTEQVFSVTFSPDGKYLASCSGDNAIKIWSTSNWANIKNLIGHTGRVSSVAFSLCGKYLASCSYDKTIKIWTTSDWANIKTITGHTSYVEMVAFSPDGKYLASCSGDKTIKIWSTFDWENIENLTGHVSSVLSVAFSLDGKYLASSSGDNTIKIWTTSDWTNIKNLTEHTNDVETVAFSPDGKYLVSGSYDYTIRIWRASDWANIKNLTGHTSSVLSVTFSPDGKYLASGSEDNTIKIWTTSDWANIKNLTGHAGSVYSVALSSDEKYLASGSDDKTIRIWGRDIDSDGFPDTIDLFPNNPKEWKDSDKDGVGDNSDAFPNDPSASKDKDKDSYPDEWNPGKKETDSTTGLKIDLFPNDPKEWADTDKDGVGDNSDAFPNDPKEWADTDEDGVGDNSDAFPNDPSASKDKDKDSYPDEWNPGKKETDSTTGLKIDLFPNDPKEWKDTDGDGIGDNSDFSPKINNNIFYILGMIIIFVIAVKIAKRVKLKKKYEMALKSSSSAEKYIENLQSMGINSSDAVAELENAKKLFNSGDYPAADRTAKNAEKIGHKIYLRYEQAKKLSSIVDAKLEDCQKNGIILKGIEEPVGECKSAFSRGDYNKVMEISKDVLKKIEESVRARQSAEEAMKKAMMPIEAAKEKGLDISNSIKLLETAEQKFRSGDYNIAIENIKKARENAEKLLAMDKKEYESKFELAQRYEKEKRYEDAVKIYSELNKDDDVQRVILQIAKEFEKKGELEKAKELYEELGALQELKLLNVKRAKKLMDKGRFEESAMIYKELEIWEEAEKAKEMSLEKPLWRGNILVSAVVDYDGLNVLYKVKVENMSNDLISEVRIKPCFQLDSFKLYPKDEIILSNAIEPRNSQTATFLLRPKKGCGVSTISGIVEYYNRSDMTTNEIKIPESDVKIICPQLKPIEIDEKIWMNVIADMFKAEEEFNNIPKSAKVFFDVLQEAIKNCNFSKVGASITESGKHYSGIAKYYAEGEKGLKFAAVVEIAGGLEKSKLTLRVYTDSRDALTGTFYAMLEEIEKKVKVKEYMVNRTA